jgi:hypothetical protein
MKTIVTQLPLVGARIGNMPLQVGEFVPAAALTARHLSAEALEDPTTLRTLYNTQQAMTRTLRQALPLETELKTGLAKRLGKIKLEIARYEHTPDFELPTMDPSFLSWKTQAGFPAFSIFRLDSDTMTLVFDRNRFSMMSLVGAEGAFSLSGLMEGRASEGTFGMFPKIPDIIAEQYLDDNLRQGLGLMCYDRNLERIELTARYGGVMPESVREHIHKWLDVQPGQPRFDEMFIIAEAPEESWEIKEIPRLDPLVIGVASGLLWLVDAYDLTPIEKFARDLCKNSSKASN